MRRVVKPFTLFLNVIAVSSLLWAITLIPGHFKNKNNYEAKEETYECGFKNTYKLNLKTKVKVSAILAFLVLYEIEMFFFVPAILNGPVISLQALPILATILIVLVVTCVIDKRLGTLEFLN